MCDITEIAAASIPDTCFYPRCGDLKWWALVLRMYLSSLIRSGLPKMRWLVLQGFYLLDTLHAVLPGWIILDRHIDKCCVCRHCCRYSETSPRRILADPGGQSFSRGGMLSIALRRRIYRRSPIAVKPGYNSRRAMYSVADKPVASPAAQFRVSECHNDSSHTQSERHRQRSVWKVPGKIPDGDAGQVHTQTMVSECFWS